MLDIYHYTDYRLFIRDYFKEKKGLNPAFSHQYFSRRAAIKSKGFMLHVMKGQRNLTRPVMLRVAQALGLNKQQTRYFDDLVTFCQAKTIGDREFYYNKLAEFRKAAKITNLDDRRYEFLNEWYHTVIRELIPLHQGAIDPAALEKGWCLQSARPRSKAP